MDTEDMILRLKDVPEVERKVRRLELALHLAADLDEKRDLERVIAAMYHAHFDLTDSSAHFARVPASLAAGELLVGETEGDGRFCLNLAELRQHLMVCGRAGSGKTNFVYLLMKRLNERGMKFLAFDWKQDYAPIDFEQLFGGIAGSRGGVHVLSVGRTPGLQFNPLIPPEGMEPSIWIKRVCEIFTHAYMGGPRFEQIIRDAVDHFYREYGVYEGKTERYPTVREVKEYLDRFKTVGREAQWMQTVQSVLSGLTFGETGRTFDVAAQPPLDFLLRENVVLDLSVLSNADKTFIVEALLLWIYHYRLAKPFASELQSVIILEEAHHVLKAKYEEEESIIDVVLREIRSLGIGVVVIDQMPSMISNVALANTYATVALNLKLDDDKAKIGRCMNLDKEQQAALGDLPIGTAVVKLADRFAKPFKLKIPFVPVQRLARCAVAVSPFARRPDSATEHRIPPKEASTDGISRIPAQIKPGLDAEMRLFTDVVRFPVSTVVDRYARLGVSPRTGNLLKKYLVREGLIEEQVIHGVSNWVKLLSATDKGDAMLDGRGVKRFQTWRHGGLEHKYWVQTIADHCWRTLGDEYEVLEEYPLGKGRTADVVVLKDDRVLVAIEVETGKSDIAQNMLKYTDLGIPKVIIAFINQKLKEDHEQLGQSHGITIKTVSETAELNATGLIEQ